MSQLTDQLQKILTEISEDVRMTTDDAYAEYHQPLPVPPKPGHVADALRKRLEGSRSLRHPDKWNLWVDPVFRHQEPAADLLDTKDLPPGIAEKIDRVSAYWFAVSVYVADPWGTCVNITPLLVALKQASPEAIGRSAVAESVVISDAIEFVHPDKHTEFIAGLVAQIPARVRDELVMPVLEAVLTTPAAEIREMLRVNIVPH